MKKAIATLVSSVLITCVCANVTAKDRYPERDITNVVVWSAGGGTDVINRMITSEMSPHLDVNINVTNRPGGVAGSLGMSYVHKLKPDGYTLVGLSESVVASAVQGGWKQRMDVWHPFIVGGSPDLISVSSNSKFNTLEDVINAVKANPKSVKASAGGAGSIHHLNLLALANGTEVEFNYIPYPGSAPAQTAVLTGEVDLVITSLAEQQQLIKGGQLKPLAMLVANAQTLEGVDTIPSAFDSFPQLQKHLPIMQAIGFAIKSDAPDSVKNKLTMAFQKAIASEKLRTWAKDNYYVLSGLSGQSASNEFAFLESLFSWTLQDLGATKISPKALGIPKPADLQMN
ncbi:tricarboxylate transport protein TctC [Marinomonas sp. SBI22]|uniref:tripartite tricarboxylate transporter substrate binding protein n=1 Tax=unclassified Marinomonas TaxID=196814 RepID=UPI0007AF51F8|nr:MULTISPECIES: tripartite tricarboxylate transporter substrate binding protein [unclassified Marinomonas]KZM45733.1 tricarboxylate transport protein TctC [Marinomonas sp. SBI22]KZM46252.1 tricarboxylate transport protein TctC [Marinomonas sp. SBI8L]